MNIIGRMLYIADQQKKASHQQTVGSTDNLISIFRVYQQLITKKIVRIIP